MNLMLAIVKYLSICQRLFIEDLAHSVAENVIDVNLAVVRDSFRISSVVLNYRLHSPVPEQYC